MPDGALPAGEEERLDAMLARRHGTGVDSRTAAYIIESVVRMRAVAGRDAAVLGGDALPPCGACGAVGGAGAVCQ